MRTLLVEPTPTGAASVGPQLADAGHEVLRCHPPGGPAFPCAGLTEVGCPLEGRGPIDVAVVVRDEPSAAPTADEAGATCAIRSGLPVVIVTPPGHGPFDRWAEPCHDIDELPTAIGRAIDGVAQRRGAPIRAEVERLLAVHGFPEASVDVSVTRTGDEATIAIRTDVDLSPEIAGAVATRAHAVDQRSTWPTTKVGITVTDRSERH